MIQELLLLLWEAGFFPACGKAAELLLSSGVSENYCGPTACASNRAEGRGLLKNVLLLWEGDSPVTQLLLGWQERSHLHSLKIQPKSSSLQRDLVCWIWTLTCLIPTTTVARSVPQRPDSRYSVLVLVLQRSRGEMACVGALPMLLKCAGGAGAHASCMR